jgi:ATP-dependent DNA ligase
MLQIKQPLPPMEAKLVDEIPMGSEWQYEPKWDGFRCLAFRDGNDILLQSKSEKPLGRYFPEIVEAVRSVKTKRFVIDGELVVPFEGALDFDRLLQRVHPSATRIRKLSAETPAIYVVFDCLAGTDGKSRIEWPLCDRRPLLDSLAAKEFDDDGTIRLSPASTKLTQARRWLRAAGGDFDGVIAKRLDMPYAAGERTAMQKIKPARTADCVVGGFRYRAKSKIVGSLLLGLYDENGLLDHVGFTANIAAAERTRLTKKLEASIKQPGFTGRSPGGPSRWSTERSAQWQPVTPKLVVEVAFDHFTGGRFRHGASFLRLRPDKSPKACTFDQVHRLGSPSTVHGRRRRPDVK